MIRKYFLPVLSLLGSSLAAIWCGVGCQKQPVAAPAAEPSHAPYKAYVAGSGIIEAATENIAVATPVPGVGNETVRQGRRPREGGPTALQARRSQSASDAGSGEGAGRLGEGETERGSGFAG